MLDRFARWFWGAVKFRILGSPERFFNHCARNGIALWEMEGGTEPGAWVRAGQYRQLRSCAREAGCRLRAQERHGLPFSASFLRRRRGLPAGTALGALLLILLSQQVWSVEFTGLQTISEQEMRAACQEIGLVPGAWKASFDPVLAEQQLMLRFPGVSWLTVNTQGSTAVVALAEGVEKPDMEAWKRPCNIRSAAAGQILRMEVYAGQAEVDAGDAVTAGQLLVSGVTEDAWGGVTLHHAAARIVAETRREFTAAVPLSRTEQVPTGRELVRRTAGLFGLRIPLTLSGEPGASWQGKMVRTALRVNGVELPVFLLTETSREFTEHEVLLSPQEALDEAKRRVEAQKSALKIERILSEEESFSQQDGMFCYTVRVVCEEDIYEETEIFLNSTN